MDKKKQKPRVDKLKNKHKVIGAILQDPYLSERKIAKAAGVSNGTAHNIKKEIEQSGATDAKSQFVLDVLEADKAIIKRGLKIIADKLNDETQVYAMKPSEVSNVIKENTARYTLFAGKATDSEGGMKENPLTESQTKALDSLLALYKKDGL